MNTIQTTAVVQLQNPAGISPQEGKSGQSKAVKPGSEYDKVDISKLSTEQSDNKHEIELIKEAIHVLPDRRTSLLDQVRQNLNNGAYFQDGVSESLAGKLIDIAA